jgi:exopolyphosphatase/guanosine-5'-triphosphate,3'-diphosphate pyrophosphatase
VRDQSTITRLGQGAWGSGVLKAEAIARTLACLEGVPRSRRNAGRRIIPVTTEGVRMARNQGDFLEPAAAVLGVPVRILSGAEEAELSYLSVARETPGGGPLRVLDIGGASTELVLGEGLQLLSAVSHPVGAVRLTERLVSGGSADAGDDRGGAGSGAGGVSGAQPVAPHPVLHALAGTVTTTAALLLGLPSYDRLAVDGSRFTRGRCWRCATRWRARRWRSGASGRVWSAGGRMLWSRA